MACTGQRLPLQQRPRSAAAPGTSSAAHVSRICCQVMDSTDDVLRKPKGPLQRLRAAHAKLAPSPGRPRFPAHPGPPAPRKPRAYQRARLDGDRRIPAVSSLTHCPQWSRNQYSSRASMSSQYQVRPASRPGAFCRAVGQRGAPAIRGASGGLLPRFGFEPRALHPPAAAAAPFSGPSRPCTPFDAARAGEPCRGWGCGA